MVTMPAAPASARRIAENTIKKECRAANNGTYSTSVSRNGDRISRCTYRDISGNWYTDHYFNGEYYDTYEHVGGPRGEADIRSRSLVRL